MPHTARQRPSPVHKGGGWTGSIPGEREVPESGVVVLESDLGPRLLLVVDPGMGTGGTWWGTGLTEDCCSCAMATVACVHVCCMWRDKVACHSSGVQTHEHKDCRKRHSCTCTPVPVLVHSTACVGMLSLMDTKLVQSIIPLL